MFAGAAAPVSAADYALRNAAITPGVAPDNTLGGIAAADGIIDVAQSGSTIYALRSLAAVNSIIVSTDGGATWAGVAGGGLAARFAAGTVYMIAVAPDDPNTVFVVDDQANPDSEVYYSANGGASFTSLGFTSENIDAYSIAISPLNVTRLVLVGGATAFPIVDGAPTGTIRQFTLPAVAGAWAAMPTAAPAGYNNYIGIGFSPNYISDSAVFAVGSVYSAGTGGATGKVEFNYYNYNLNSWNDGGAATSVKVGANSSTLFNATKSDFAFDALFSNDDPASRTAFVSVNLISPAATYPGGVYSLIGGAQIVNTSSNGVAWDGTNLLSINYLGAAATATGLTVRYSANPLGAVPLVSVNAAGKFPSTGYNGNVLFSAGTAYAFSQGPNGGIAKSTDLGKNWNGIKYVSTAFTTIESSWFSPDASVKYAIVDDGTDTNVWRQKSGVWERVFIVTGAAGVWLVRADADIPASLWIGKVGNPTMWKSNDSGEKSWSNKNTNQSIADFVVQDYATVYIAITGTPTITKTTTGGYGWSNPVITVPFAAVAGGNCFSLNLISDNNLLVGGSTGGVAYSTNGATFTAVGAVTDAAGPGAALGNTVVTATGLAAGGTIYAAAEGVGGVFGEIASWTIGTSVAFTNLQALTVAGASKQGIIISNGVVYALDNASLKLYRFLAPGTVNFAIDVYNGFAGAAYTQDVNTLIGQTTAGTVSTIWTINNTGTDTYQKFSDYLTSPTTIPTLVYPVDGAIIPVNSISGDVSSWLFKWTAPAVTSVGTVYSYDFFSYMDELGTIGLTAPAPYAGAGVNVTMPSGAAGAGLTVPTIVMPGITYYWNVKVSAGTPATSYPTAIKSFIIQQLQAIVPVLTSPQNGAMVDLGSEAFSWNPISGATKYQFQLDTGTTFVVPAIDQTSTSAGFSLPIATNLERGRLFFWRVRVVEPAVGEWSTVGNFKIAEEVIIPSTITTTAPAVTVTPTTVIQTTFTIPQGSSTVLTLTQTTQTTTDVNPTYIWAIIIIGAVLVIAVIVLIVRTRRSV